MQRVYDPHRDMVIADVLNRPSEPLVTCSVVPGTFSGASFRGVDLVQQRSRMWAARGDLVQCLDSQEVIGSHTFWVARRAVLCDSFENLHAPLEPPLRSKCSGPAEASLLCYVCHARMQLKCHQVVGVKVLLDEDAVLKQCILGSINVLRLMLTFLISHEVYHCSAEMSPHLQNPLVHSRFMQGISGYSVRPGELVLHRHVRATACARMFGANSQRR